MAFKMKGFPMHEGVPHDKDPEKYPGPDLSNLAGTRTDRYGRETGTISELPEWEPSRDELLDMMDESKAYLDYATYKPPTKHDPEVVQEGKDKYKVAQEMWRKMGYDKESPTKKRTKADRIRGRKGGTVKNVTERLDEGDYKSARLERRGNVAASKGKKAKAKRLRRKAAKSSQKFFEKQVQRSREK